MIDLKEYSKIYEEVERLVESEQTFFTDEQIDQAEFYELKWNPVNFKTAIHIFDSAGQPIASVEFDDAEYAMEYVESIFELDEEDLLSLNSYQWASDIENRVYAALDDDGTSDAE